MGMIKEGIVDFKRHKTDKETNSQACQVYDKKTKTFLTK
jgi:hypothetical protein